MTIRIRSSEEQFVIYREGAGVVVFVISLAIGCAAFGALFFYVSDGNVIFLAFGSLFIVASALVLTAFPKYFRRIKNDNGAVLLVADKSGVSIAPVLGMAPVSYSWADVSQILLTKKLIAKEVGERTFCWNQIIVYFRRGNVSENVSLMKRGKDQLWRSPKGRNISVIDFPKGEIIRVKNELVRFFSDSDVPIFNEVIFDYAENTERFQP